MSEIFIDNKSRNNEKKKQIELINYRLNRWHFGAH